MVGFGCGNPIYKPDLCGVVMFIFVLGVYNPMKKPVNFTAGLTITRWTLPKISPFFLTGNDNSWDLFRYPAEYQFLLVD